MSRRNQVDLTAPFVTSHLFALGTFVFMLYLTVRTVTMGPMSAVTPLAVFGLAIWFFTGRTAWWMPVPLAVAFGGLIWAGFKIYMHEIAMLLALLALLPVIAMKIRVRGVGPARVPNLLWLMLAYLVILCGNSMIIYHGEGLRALSHLLRSYTDAIWAVAFAILYYLYGSSRHARLALMLIYGTLMLRSALALYQFYFPNFVFLNMFGSLLMVSPGREFDLRDSALRLIVLSVGFFFATRKTTARIGLVLMALLATWLVLVSSSRVTVATLLVIPPALFLLRRQYVPLLLSGGALGLVLLVLNMFPDTVDNMPAYARRALSGLVFSRTLDIHAVLEASNEWHRLLMQIGFERWSENPLTMLFGRPIEPFDESFFSINANFYDNALIAAKTARYESALWTLLATQGIVGVVLLAAVYYKLLRDPLRELARRGICDIQTCLYFCAGCHVLIYVIFSWIAGTFPGYELVLAIMAKAAYDDRALEEYQRARASEAPDFSARKRVTTMFEPV